MGKKLVSKTAKVLSETKKSKDKEAIAIAYEHIPRNPEEQAHGSLYAVLELEDKSGHAEEIAEGIIDALHNEYYLDTDREPLASFEAALAKINEELAERSGEGQINWLGKLNGVLAVLTGSTIHLTQAGKAEAYLYRGDHAMHITEDLAGDAINPLRTFINIASGDLAENDRLALVTPGIFLKVSKNELKKYVTENSPKNAVSALSQLLSAENGISLPNSVLIMEMISPEAFAAEPEPEVPSEAWVKEEKKPLEEVGTGTIHGAAKTFDLLGKATAAASTFISTRAIPAIKKTTGKISSRFTKEPDSERIILESEERLHSRGNIPSEFDDDGILDTNEKAEGYQEIRIKESETKPKRLSLERFDFSFAKNASNSFFTTLKRNRNSGVYIIIGIVLLLGLFGGLIYRSNVTKAKTAAQNQMTQANAKYDEAQAALGAGQRQVALEDLKAAESLANNAKASKYQKDNAESLLAKISETKNQAMGIVKNTATLFYDFGIPDLSAFYSDGSMMYAVKYSNGAIFALDPKSKSKATIIANAKISSPIKFSAFVPTRKVIVAVTEDNTLYELSISAKRATKQTVSGGLAKGVALATYGSSNIYLLVPSANQIYKYVKSGGGYGSKTNYISSQTTADVTGGTALAIDSSVYVTTAGGTVQKYTLGKLDSYSVKGYPGSFNGIDEILATADIKGQYLANKTSVIKIDQNQTFQSQYTSDTVKDIKGIFVSDPNTTIYTLSEGKIFATIY